MPFKVDADIISRFYIIYGDDKPIYVGYTNRSVSQRFSEHKRNKDFSNYKNVYVKEVDKLEFEFTWDEEILYHNAKVVSDKESELIIQYQTYDSPYQKGSSNLEGGNTWTYIKTFVKRSKGNPKYNGISNKDIMARINYFDTVRTWISSAEPYWFSLTEENVVKNLVTNNFVYPEKTWVSSLINHNMINKDKLYVQSMVSSCFISPNKRWVSSLIYNNFFSDERQWVINLVNHNFISNNKLYISHFVNNYFK